MFLWWLFLRGSWVSPACPIQMVLQLDVNLQTALFKLELKPQQQQKWSWMNSVPVKETELWKGGRNTAKPTKCLSYLYETHRFDSGWLGTRWFPRVDLALPLFAGHMERDWLPRSSSFAEGARLVTTGTRKCHKSFCSVVPEAGLDRRFLHPHRPFPLDSFPLVCQDALTKIPYASLKSCLVPEEGPTCWAPQFWGISHSPSEPTALPLTPFYRGTQIWEQDIPT